MDINFVKYIVVCLIIHVPVTTSLAQRNTIKVCQHKNCIKQYANGNLMETFNHLLSPESSSDISIESSGCLSGCGKGPNVNIQSNGDMVYGGISDPFDAAMLLDSECSYKCNSMLIAACDVMAQAKGFKSDTKKEKYLSSVISSLSANAELSLSNALVSAYLDRADVRMQLDKIADAIDDCNRAIQIEPNNGKSYRKLAETLEIKGDTLGAIEAVSKWAEVDSIFQAKARKELKRLGERL